MSREIKRVAVDFEWPLKKTWGGYLRPDKFDEVPCPDCKNGYSPFAQYLFDQWYGYVDFDPRSTGSIAFTQETPEVRAFAERNVRSAPEFYGTGERAILREANRLLTHWNGMLMHHISPADVKALIDDGRLMDFTHTWSRETRWQVKDPAYVPTAAEVNAWSLTGMAHDSINASVVIRARCQREGFGEICASCGGHASTERYPGQRAEAEEWTRTEPPEGDGWQVWETTSEGSPISPVFDSREGVVEFLMSDQYYGFGTSPTPLSRSQAEAFVGAGSSIGSFVAVNGELINGDAAVEALGGRP